MNIDEILEHYDNMYGRYSLEEIEKYLVSCMDEAKRSGETDILFTLLNEIVGFCRDTTQNEKGLKYCSELKDVLDLLNINGTMEYGTSLLNIANAYRAFGLYNESLKNFQETENIYKKYLDSFDFGWANLYNNWGLLYQETEDYPKAAEILLKALKVVDKYDDASIQQAVTRSNLASSLIEIKNPQIFKHAMQYLNEALKIYEDDGGSDFHYPAALVTMGDAYSYMNDYKKAKDYYAKGLKELEKHVGKNDNYMRVLEKYNYADSLAADEPKWESNLLKSKRFYEQHGKTMIHNRFGAYEDRIAVGMVGDGSDCYGFDDEISGDHDYDIGFCMWLTESDYKAIGEKLESEYERLVSFYGNGGNNALLSQRRGVFSINDFYNHYLETAENYEAGADIHFESIPEEQLSLASNGAVFKDSMGIFTAVRTKILGYYPNKIWKMKLAEALHNFSQYAQSNYPRMMARQDSITASLCLNKAAETTMDLVYLLNHSYAPYYKWKRRGIETSALGKKILPLLNEIIKLPLQSSAWENVKYSSAVLNTNDRCVVIFENIAEILLAEMNRQGIVKGNDLFLEVYLNQLLGDNKMNYIDEIVNLEWKQFDSTKNEGGRASCQNNYPTFVIMRKSQYLTWNEELLKSYLNDLINAENRGWNLITEKYARMMKSTCPEKYAELENVLPKLSEKRIAIQEEIIKIQVAWMEEFAKEYPHMAGNARSIRTSSDSEDNTSYETYLRGEMSTYSDETFVLYGRFVASLVKEGKNLAYEIMTNTAHLYGYKTIDEAEKNN